VLKGNSLILLGVAIIVALAAVFATNAFLTRSEQQAAQVPSGGVQIAVAAVPLDFGAEVTADKIKMVPWPAGSVPEGAFGSPTELTTGKPRFALRPIQVGEPVLRSRVSGLNGRATLAANLKNDTRAMTVRVSDVSGVAGFALPGDVVDVLLTRSAGGDSAQQISDVLIQAVKVIAVDQIASENKSDPMVAKTATLEVTPLDAQKLALAQQVGTISLALRPIGETVRPLIETVSLEDLRDKATVGRAADYWSPPAPQANAFAAAPAAAARVIRRRAAPAPAKPANLSTVQVYRGTASTDYQVKRHAGL
jgi:pilus assembly protein CpaB